jgi:hypothetical protein
MELLIIQMIVLFVLCLEYRVEIDQGSTIITMVIVLRTHVAVVG